MPNVSVIQSACEELSQGGRLVSGRSVHRLIGGDRRAIAAIVKEWRRAHGLPEKPPGSHVDPAPEPQAVAQVAVEAPAPQAPVEATPAPRGHPHEGARVPFDQVEQQPVSSYRLGHQGMRNRRTQLLAVARSARRDREAAGMRLEALQGEQAQLAERTLTQAKLESSAAWLTRGVKSKLPSMRAQMETLLEKAGMERHILMRADDELRDAMAALLTFDRVHPAVKGMAP